MKSMKKIASILLALAMVLSMATFVSADNQETTTAYQYEIYQIFVGDFENDVLSDIKWGQNGIGAEGVAVDASVLETLEAVDSASSNSDKLDVINAYVDLESEAYQTLDTDSATASVNDLPAGYYLVKDAAGSQDGLGEAYTSYVVKVVDGTLTINRKASVPQVDKVIVDNGEVKENQVSIGDTVNYKFTGTVAANIAEFDTYYYVFTDTMAKGLTYTNGLTVTVNGVDVTNYFYVNTTEYSETDGTTITVGIQDLLALELLESPAVGQITPATEVVVTYTAVLNENAIVGTIGNKNDVDLEYANDPNDDGEGATVPPSENPGEPVPTVPTGMTPKSEVFTYTTELIVIKVDENGNRLTGAAFKIEGDGVNKVVVTTESFVEDANGTYYKLKDGTYTDVAPVTEDDPDTTDVNEKTSDSYASTTQLYTKTTNTEVKEKTESVSVEAYVGDDGVLKFTGLGAGRYVITETVTPAGYNSIEPITVTISWSEDGTDCTWIYDGTTEYTEDDQGDPVYTNVLTITNYAGSTLPETGGMGTTLFYVIGGILVLAAVVLLVTKKRMSMK